MSRHLRWPWIGRTHGAALLSALALWGCGSSDDGGLRQCMQPTADGSVVVGSGLPGDPAIPEPQSGFRTGKKAVTAVSYMAVTANPLATQAACETLRDGGTAVDAAVAAQMVLGLVEPQSSGIGGGAFLMHYEARSGTVQTYDGRETAPAAATEDYLRYISGAERTNPLPALASAFASTRASGRSVGVPGAVRMLELAHQDYGRKPWGSLFQPGIQLATNRFAISGRLAAAISGARDDLLRDADARAYFLNPDYSPKALGTTLRNPAYASTLQAIAQGGANAFYTGEIAQAIVDDVKATSGGATTTVAITPGLMELSDLAAYRAIRRPPVCSTYRNTWVCGMGPPSSGGIAVAQTLGILENFDLASLAPTQVDLHGGRPQVMAVHLVSEAERLAYADRNRYVADTDFVPLPGAGVASLLDRNYLRQRAQLISTTRSMGTAQPGVFGTPAMGSSENEGRGTTHLSIVDKYGNAVAMTTTIESSMGSFRFTRGFLLNNELTDFSFEPTDASGPIANRVQPGKRPRSSMAPTLVFHRAADGGRGELRMVTGSPGGAAIIQFVVKTLVGAIDWGLNAQQATSLVNFGAANSPTTGVGGEHPAINAAGNGENDPLVTGLRALGHTVSVAAQSSGVSTILRKDHPAFGKVLEGGADPRREGLALGDLLP
jgi:gamma-glutamyltranspeptidase/glutathione hydrolase